MLPKVARRAAILKSVFVRVIEKKIRQRLRDVSRLVGTTYNKLPGRTYTNRKEALKNRVKDLKELKDDLLEIIPTPGINPFKRAELVNNFRKEIPPLSEKTGERYADNELYVDLTPEELSKVKMEAKMNHEKKVEVANMKKRKFADTLEATADTSGVLEVANTKKRKSADTLDATADTSDSKVV